MSLASLITEGGDLAALSRLLAVTVLLYEHALIPPEPTRRSFRGFCPAVMDFRAVASGFSLVS